MLAGPVAVPQEAPTPSAAAMAAATRTPPLQAVRLRETLGMETGTETAASDAAVLLQSDAFRHY
jgi:hypothetical protein